ncbi:MAG: GNAT family N-acetyltransferase [Proteobacteria bacterium]|nr:GNAT family N-acetyltransferase [Pseudomonadota bacterium]
MIDPRPPIRPATVADAAALARLVNFAGEGMPLYFWRRIAGDGEDPWEIGRRRQGERVADSTIFVVDEGGGAVACLTGYPVPAFPEPVGADEPDIFRPLAELENLAPLTWYVNVLAALPEHRGRGFGARLLALAEDIARDRGLPAMSLIISSGNAGARRLYQRTGYVEIARREIVKDGWECASDEWVLLIKRL